MTTWFRKQRRRLFWQMLPKRLLCYARIGHKWEDPDPVIIDGPIDLPPREREWVVLAFHKQCERCYIIKGVGYTFADAERAVRMSIEEDEGEEVE